MKGRRLRGRILLALALRIAFSVILFCPSLSQAAQNSGKNGSGSKKGQGGAQNSNTGSSGQGGFIQLQLDFSSIIVTPGGSYLVPPQNETVASDPTGAHVSNQGDGAVSLPTSSINSGSDEGSGNRTVGAAEVAETASSNSKRAVESADGKASETAERPKRKRRRGRRGGRRRKRSGGNESQELAASTEVPEKYAHVDRKAKTWAGRLRGAGFPMPRGATPADYLPNLVRLVNLESNAERDHGRKMADLADKKGDKLGLQVSNLDFAGSAPGLGGTHDFTFKVSPKKKKRKEHPFQTMPRGTLVSIMTPGGDSISGTVTRVDGDEIVVNVNEPIELPEEHITVRQLSASGDADSVTNLRMMRALRRIGDSKEAHNHRMFEIMTGQTEARVPQRLVDVEFRDEQLDDYKREAVRIGLSARDVAVTRGPPATGKTRMIRELAFQEVARGGKVLIAAPSNVAVDTIWERLLEWEMNVVRVGQPSRVAAHLEDQTIAAAIEQSGKGGQLRYMREQLAAMGPGVQDYKKHRRRMERHINQMVSQLRRDYESSADVVLATQGSLNVDDFSEPFDLVILDESSQSSEPLSWIPLLLAKRVVFVGDPRQLGPTIISREAQRQGLRHTLLSRMIHFLPNELQTMLRIQYRMNQEIMEFPSRQWYRGKLIAHPSVARQRLYDLEGVENNWLTSTPTIFFDTADSGYRDKRDPATGSYYNMGEAKFARRLYQMLADSGVIGNMMGFITPYAAQNQLIAELIGDLGVETSSVDGYQGREKAAIGVSMTRSNGRGQLGHVWNDNRTTVQLTRAMRAQYVFGDSRTLSRYPAFDKYIQWLRRRGYYAPAKKLFE